MNEWIEKNNQKVIYGLAIIVVILLIAFFSTRSNFTQEVAKLGKTNSDLTAESEAKNKEIGEAKDQIDELTRNLEEAKGKIDELTRNSGEAKDQAEKLTVEIAQMTASNGELSGKATSLEASLLDAKVELDRLDMVALLRKTNIENLKNEVTVLKRAETESGEVIAELRREAEAANTRIGQLEKMVESLSDPNN